jgi:nucleotide-binding universal stress UspA family protein
MAASRAIVDASPIVNDLKTEGEALLDRAAEAARAAGVEAQRRSLEGEPAQRLLELAAQLRCTVILMGTHNRGGLKQVFAASATEALLRGSTIPVLTVCAGVTHRDAERRSFQRIVVGVDESRPSEAAIAAVLALPAEDREQVFFYSVADTADDREQAERVVGKAVRRGGCVWGRRQRARNRGQPGRGTSRRRARTRGGPHRARQPRTARTSTALSRERRRTCRAERVVPGPRRTHSERYGCTTALSATRALPSLTLEHYGICATMPTA